MSARRRTDVERAESPKYEKNKCYFHEDCAAADKAVREKFGPSTRADHHHGADCDAFCEACWGADDDAPQEEQR